MTEAIIVPGFFAGPIQEFKDLRTRAFAGFIATHAGDRERLIEMFASPNPVAYKRAAEAAGKPLKKTDTVCIMRFHNMCHGIASLIKFEHPNTELAHFTSTASLIDSTPNERGHASTFLEGCRRDQDPVYAFYTNMIASGRPEASAIMRYSKALIRLAA